MKKTYEQMVAFAHEHFGADSTVSWDDYDGSWVITTEVDRDDWVDLFDSEYAYMRWHNAEGYWAVVTDIEDPARA